MLGTFLEISVHSPDVLASLEFYERSGFTQVLANDTWKHKYGIVTDGRCFIGIHSFDFPAPALTFVAPELRRRVESLESAGAEFEFLKLGDDEFHELGFFLPDEQMVTLLEARTFSPPTLSIRSSLLGFFAEYRIPVRDRGAAASQWLRFELLDNEPPDSLHDTHSLCCTGLNIGLTETARLRRPALVFHTPDLAETLEALAERDITPAKVDMQEGTARLIAPEGSELLLVDESRLSD